MTRYTVFTTKPVCILACAVALAASGAHAGGAVVVAPEAAVASLAAKSFWTGVWSGVSLGQNFAAYGLGLGFDTIAQPQNVFGLKLPALGSTGGLAGVELGYGRDLGNGWVAGLQLDYTASSTSNESGINFGAGTIGGGNPPITLESTLQAQNMTSGLGRLGYLTSESTMIYGLLGVTHGNFRVSFSGTAGDDFATTGAGLALTAPTIGAGIETRISEKTSLKLEYRMTDFGDYSLIDQPVNNNLAVNAGFSTQSQSVRATLAIRF
jgi:outer membrane immunogenic protein